MSHNGKPRERNSLAGWKSSKVTIVFFTKLTTILELSIYIVDNYYLKVRLLMMEFRFSSQYSMTNMGRRQLDTKVLAVCTLLSLQMRLSVRFSFSSLVSSFFFFSLSPSKPDQLKRRSKHLKMFICCALCLIKLIFYKSGNCTERNW